MSKARLIGYNMPYIPNNRGGMRRRKLGRNPANRHLPDKKGKGE